MLFQCHEIHSSGEKKFHCVSSHLDLDSNPDLDVDINRHFYLNSFSHGVKIEVKQVADNYTWLYNENQYLYVKLSDFCNCG